MFAIGTSFGFVVDVATTIAAANRRFVITEISGVVIVARVKIVVPIIIIAIDESRHRRPSQIDSIIFNSTGVDSRPRHGHFIAWGRILDARIALAAYDGALRQVTVTDLGHEEPTILLTNQLTRKTANLVERYAQRMIIENSIADGIDFFHMDALSSAVAMKVNCDLQLTLMASSLYRLLAGRIGQGYEHAKSRHLFQDFVDASAHVTMTKSDIVVRYQKRAHNPLLVAAGFDTTETAIAHGWGVTAGSRDYRSTAARSSAKFRGYQRGRKGIEAEKG